MIVYDCAIDAEDLSDDRWIGIESSLPQRPSRVSLRFGASGCASIERSKSRPHDRLEARVFEGM